MTPLVPLVLLIMLLGGPNAVSVQLGMGVHLGTTGLGGDLAVALGEHVQLRGTAGVMPIEPSWTVSDIEVTSELSNSFLMAGIDLFPSGSGLRLGGGVLFKPDDPVLTGELAGPTQIGGQTYTPAQIGRLIATVESTEAAPYLMIGFGKHASAGIGLFVDLGVAFVGESAVDLESWGGTLSGNAHFRTELAREEAEWQERLDDADVYPILNLGLRVGIGN